MGNWASSFTACLVIMLIIEFITPETKHAKHIRLASSILFIAAMITPFFDTFTDFDQNDVYNATSLLLENTESKTYALSNSYVYEDYVLRAYETRLDESFRKLMEENNIDFSGDISFDIVSAQNDVNFGSIKSIKVEGLNDDDADIIKKIIKEFYSVDEINIYINEGAENVNE